MYNTRNLHMQICVFAFALLFGLVSVFSMSEESYALPKKPAKVTGLRVVSTNHNYVSIKWNKAKNAKKYEIYRATKRAGKYKKIKTITGTKFLNKKVKTGTTYWYKIRAINGIMKGKYSGVVKGTPRLDAPGFTAESTGKGPKLTVMKVKGATGYMFYRDGKLIKKQKKTVFTDSAVGSKTPHTYKVKAYKKTKNYSATSPFSRTLAASKYNVQIKLKNCKTVKSMKVGGSFDICGTIESNITIKRLEIGFVNRSTNKWVSKAKYDKKNLSVREFDIADAKNSISFANLGSGTYSYRIYAHLQDGSIATVLNSVFSVNSGKGASAIVAKAKQCAWPYGTPLSKYKYAGGKPTQAYKDALYQAYGDRKSWGKKPRAGASCDVFVGTVVRASGVDTKFPRGLDEIVPYCKKNPGKWISVKNKSMDNMKPGDVVFQLFKFGGGHTCIYIGNGMVAQAHYAHANGTYGEIGRYKYSMQSASNCKQFYVFRYRE